MSSSVNPWITDFLIGLAESHGGDTSKFTESGKKKLVQITKYIFYGSTNPEERSPIWALVSDKVMEIPVKFSSESVAGYLQEHNKRLTQNKTCLLKLKKYKLSFGRIPVQPVGNPNLTGGQKLSGEAYLFLDVADFEVMGSINENVWCKDTLKKVEGHPELREWIGGLRKGGGDGNVLKLRKQERDAQKPPAPGGKPPPKQARLDLPAKDETSRAKAKPTSKTSNATINTDKSYDSVARERERYWSRYIKYPLDYIIPDDTYPDLHKLKVYGEPSDTEDGKPEERLEVSSKSDTNTESKDAPPPKRRRIDSSLSSATPVHKEPEKASDSCKVKKTGAKRFDPLNLDSSQPQSSQKEEQQSGHSNETQPSQQATPPPSEPAQESEREHSPSASSKPLSDWTPSPRQSPAPEELEALGPSSPCLPTTPQRLSRSLSSSPSPASYLTAPTPAQRRRISYSPPEIPRRDREYTTSSPSCVMATQSILYLPSSLDPGIPANVVRVVPPPKEPERVPIDLEASPKVLVPCSDSGGSQSQSQSQGLSWESQENAPVNPDDLSQSAKPPKSKEMPPPSPSIRPRSKESRTVPPALPKPSIPSAKHTTFSQISVVPETQPQRPEEESETEDEDDEVGIGKLVPPASSVQPHEPEQSSQENDKYSLEVHPGTQSGEEKNGKQQDGHTNVKHPAAAHAQTPPAKGTSRLAEDDEQTMQSLFGSYQSVEEGVPQIKSGKGKQRERSLSFVAHDPNAWKQPAFMNRGLPTAAKSRRTEGIIQPRKSSPPRQQPQAKASVVKQAAETAPPALARNAVASSSRRQLEMVPVSALQTTAPSRANSKSQLPAKPEPPTLTKGQTSAVQPRPGDREKEMDRRVAHSTNLEVAESAKTRGKKRSKDAEEVEGPNHPARKKKRPAKGKLNGFSLNLDNQPASGGLVDWDHLQGILLKTGRERSKQYRTQGS
ncbi:hypothetical protein VNI00_001794 [Paramarasmius palmivorus]|uniref:Shelterin complex subunit TPP1/Est3 domain-containing protein n=1 Tax=Paramarasmius palmivorus TaxID=297713 RepID=A0AAW0E4X3_9AGAR